MLHVAVFLVGIGLGAGFMFFFMLDARKRLRVEQQEAERRLAQVSRQEQELEHQRSGYITLDDLRKENALLKRDLHNIDVNLNKLELDRDRDREAQSALDERSQELSRLYLGDNVKWIGSSITANNYVACKQRLIKVIEQCRAIGFDIPQQREKELITDLQSEFEKAVRAALEREEQARIKAQIREEEQLRREVERELKQLEREREAIKSLSHNLCGPQRDVRAGQV